jgi:glutamyl-tRNA synthetase
MGDRLHHSFAAYTFGYYLCNMEKRVRVRFAPSPTGGLHLGGVRTVLYNYLFAKANGGDFILRIEDTDQNRFVAGAEQYILDCLEWCGLVADENTVKGGPYAPYRQSERKDIYQKYAMQLIQSGNAYYAFDTPEELEQMRHQYASGEHGTAQYGGSVRMKMRNSLTLQAAEVQQLLEAGTPYVIRIKMPENQSIAFTDMIRGPISFDSNLVDDKVLLKADGMPTYHLAVVVDDYLMKISHAFRGEEWLPSAPVHLLLWEYLGWIADMPQWAHLPLILKPDGNGKLSKRDGDRLGFPVFAMNWTDPKTDTTSAGFREIGFLPDAFVNMLAMLGWNDGSGQEIFSMQDLIAKFDIGRVHKGGAKFDYDKAKWFNHQYIQQKDSNQLALLAAPYIKEGIQAATTTNGDIDLQYLERVVPLIKERCTLLADFWPNGHFFFVTPAAAGALELKDKWNDTKNNFFATWLNQLDNVTDWNEATLEDCFNTHIAACGLKKGDAMLPLRIMLVGGKYGPGVFQIANLIGREETLKRINAALQVLA